MLVEGMRANIERARKSSKFFYRFILITKAVVKFDRLKTDIACLESNTVRGAAAEECILFGKFQ